MERATDAVIDTLQELDGRAASPVDLRTAAYVLAIRRVAEVALSRGIWP